MPTFKRTPAGTVGLPEGQKEAGQRVDFKPDKFVLAIETKGYRLAWKRGAWCPCRSANTQSDQADPLCSVCDGKGFLEFAPAGAVVDETTVGELDAVQKALVQDAGVIRGIMTSLQGKDNPYDVAHRHLEGMSFLSVRHENALGYYDQVVNLDAEIAYFQLVEADGTDLLELRYLATLVNLLRSADTVYAVGTHFSLEAGKIRWNAGQEPAQDTTLVAHYLCHPTWRVVERPNIARNTPVAFKTTTPGGDPNPLPVRAVVKLEFLL